ncbi:hypothetical protein BE17_39030 [Sorangium cellulosum]|uniref:Uncharacterized protein n=1 Tax=Sorangium cellulosum TaxID=56 RepID=A0A150SNC9_SORCE|nr:hypothetical protein BE17_39030 [Sorangium cellulosum]
MLDPDELDAIAEAVLAEEDDTSALSVAPGLVLELTYDSRGAESTRIWRDRVAHWHKSGQSARVLRDAVFSSRVGDAANDEDAAGRAVTRSSEPGPSLVVAYRSGFLRERPGRPALRAARWMQEACAAGAAFS